MKNNKLLAIGDFAKYSDRSIKSIHYYERLGILTPAFVDPETNYRYYSIDQVLILETAQFFTELDIPLKEIPAFLDENNRLKSTDFLIHAQEIAEVKLKKIQQTLSAISHAKSQVKKSEYFEINSAPYEVKIQERYFYTAPFHDSENFYEFRKNMLGVFNSLIKAGIPEDTLLDMENGICFDYRGLNVTKCYFIEVPEQYEEISGSLIKLPTGNYQCLQSYASMIEKATLLFNEKPLFAFELEMFSDPYDLNRPLWELLAFLPSKNQPPLPYV